MPAEAERLRLAAAARVVHASACARACAAVAPSDVLLPQGRDECIYASGRARHRLKGHGREQQRPMGNGIGCRTGSGLLPRSTRLPARIRFGRRRAARKRNFAAVSPCKVFCFFPSSCADSRFTVGAQLPPPRHKCQAGAEDGRHSSTRDLHAYSTGSLMSVTAGAMV